MGAIADYVKVRKERKQFEKDNRHDLKTRYFAGDLSGLVTNENFYKAHETVKEYKQLERGIIKYALSPMKACDKVADFAKGAFKIYATDRAKMVNTYLGEVPVIKKSREAKWKRYEMSVEDRGLGGSI